jgi:hypothetical protein
MERIKERKRKEKEMLVIRKALAQNQLSSEQLSSMRSITEKRGT